MDDLIITAKNKIPSLDYILEETWDRLNLNKEDVSNSFSNILVSFDNQATQIFRGYEKQALFTLAQNWLSGQKQGIKIKFEHIVALKGWEDFINEASKVFVDFATYVQALEKSLGNMRKARGGKTFEKVINKLLNFIDIESELPSGKAREKLRRIDIVIPSIEIALNTPDRAVFLTCKRTLRERWKQEVPQARLNQRIYLVTMDSNLAVSKANEINEKGFIAFVRDEIKTSSNEINEMHWIRKLSDLPHELGNYEK